MTDESYTPGHSNNAVEFMAERSLESHGQFFLPHLRSTDSVLDVGCGPGTMTLGIAAQVKQGHVWAIDFRQSQVALGNRRAAVDGIPNVRFATASCYELPFATDSFDCVFCHALMEHLAQPERAIREFARVLKPGGTVGVCSPDFDGTLLAPATPEVIAAKNAYAAMQESNGGDLRMAKSLGRLVQEAGFCDIQLHARYECYPSLTMICDYLALQLDAAGQPNHATTLRTWSRTSPGLFAQCWVSAVGTASDGASASPLRD